jgi:hypothetical protein
VQTPETTNALAQYLFRKKKEGHYKNTPFDAKLTLTLRLFVLNYDNYISML